MEQGGTQPTKSTAVRLGAYKCPISKSKSGIMGWTLKLVYVQTFETSDFVFSIQIPILGSTLRTGLNTEENTESEFHQILIFTVT